MSPNALDNALDIAILTVSDRAERGEYQDTTGPTLVTTIEQWPHCAIVSKAIVADERRDIAEYLREWSTKADLIITNGGTGLGPRDTTPEATRDVIDKEAPGLAELMRATGVRNTPFAALSRQVVGLIGDCLVVNLPGSPKGALEALAAIADLIPHAIATAKGNDHQ